MQHSIAAAHGFIDPMRIAYVTSKNLDVLFNLSRRVVQPPPRIERVIHHESANRIPFAHKRLGQVRAYEAICTGDEDFVHISWVILPKTKHYGNYIKYDSLVTTTRF